MAGKIQREFDNLLATIHDLASRAEEWSSRPSWLEFAPNNVCNLRCVMCGQSDGMPVVAMKRDEVRELLGDLLPTVSLWTPMAVSEPFLNDFRVIIEQARKHEIWLNVQTNGTLLTPERFLMMVDRLYKLHISLDSHRKEVFEAIRVGADFDQTIANIKAVMPLVKEHGIPLAFVVVVMTETVPHIADYVDFIADLGGVEVGAEVRLHGLLDLSRGCKTRHCTQGFTADEIEAFLDDACERARARGLTFGSTLDHPFDRAVIGAPPPQRLVMPDLLMQMIVRIRREYPGFCSMASNYARVEPNGDVFPCCRAPRELKMGNTKDQPFEEIWNGAKYREFRRRMFAGDYPEPCRTCDVLVANPHFRSLGERGETTGAPSGAM